MGAKVKGTYMTVAVRVADEVDLDELVHAGCPYVKVLPQKAVLDREAIWTAIKEGRASDLPNGVTFTVYGGYSPTVIEEAV